MQGVRLALAALLVLTTCSARAQSWPSKPLTIISPYSAGGITDVLCRIVAEELAKLVGQPVLVDDRVGAGGAIAMQAAARAPADGYTLVMGGSAVSTILPALSRTTTYDPVKDFEPIAYVAALPIVLVASMSLPATNLKEFVAYAKTHGADLNCGHHGVGTGTHLACVEFGRLIGVRIADIPYKGAPQVNADLLADRVQFYFGTLPTEIGYVRAGRLRSFGVAAAQRVDSAADIPTLAEQGIVGLNLDTWNALYVPAGTPRAVVDRLRSELQKILATPAVRKRIEDTGSVLHPIDADALRSMTLQQYEQYRRLSADTRIHLD